jgi:hypothetical protein
MCFVHCESRKCMGYSSLLRKPLQVLSTWTCWRISCCHNWQRILSRKLRSFNKIEHHLTITEECDSSLTNICQDIGLGERDQSLGLQGHPTFLHETSFGGTSENTFMSHHNQEQSRNWRNAFLKPRHQWMPICYIEPGKGPNTGCMFAVLLEVHT